MKIESKQIVFEKEDINHVILKINSRMDMWTHQHKDEIKEGERILGDDDVTEITKYFYGKYKRTLSQKKINKDKFKQLIFSALKELLKAREDKLRLRMFKVSVLIYKESRFENLIEKYEFNQEFLKKQK